MGVLPIIAARIAGIRQRYTAHLPPHFSSERVDRPKAADLAAYRRNERRPE
jgi:hypothetical protein